MKNAALGYREGCTCMFCLPETTARSKIPKKKPKLQAGRYYKDRTGKIWGPIVPYRNLWQPELDFAYGSLLWDKFGRFWPGADEDSKDLIEETGPIVILMDKTIVEVTHVLYDALSKHSIVE